MSLTVLTSDQAATGSSTPAFVYLVSCYPTVNHTYLLNEIRELRKCGFDLTVISISPPDRAILQLQDAEREEAERTLYIKPVRVWRYLLIHFRCCLQRPLSYFSGLLFALRLTDGDLSKVVAMMLYFAEAVVVGEWTRKGGLRHLHSQFTSTVALLVTKIFPLTFSMTIHGPDEFNDVTDFHLAQKLAAAQFAFSISDYGRSQMMRFSAPKDWPKIQVSRLGVNTDTYEAPHLYKETGAFHLVCVARLSPVKAQRILLEACAEVKQNGHAIVLDLVGGGPDWESLRERVKELGLYSSVMFHNAKPHDEVLRILSQADAFVLASFAEGIPVALMEAMALGIPCIATGVMGVPELIRPGIDGLLVAPSDVLGLRDAIQTLILNPDLRDRFSRSGRARVCEGYNLAQNTGALANAFRMRLGSSHPD